MNTVQQQREVVKLVPPPKPTKDNILGYTWGIRPYRKGGIRLEREDICGKIIYHNYGHGGAGVSLAYGAAKKIVDKFLMEVGSKVKTVAIIGSGYMGLFQGLMLKDLGYNVNIYASQFPVKLGIYKEGGLPMITSQVAGGLWMPYGYDLTNKALHDSMAKETFLYYKQCIDKKIYKGLSYSKTVIMDIKNPVPEFVPDGLIQTKLVKVDFGNGVLHDAEIYNTILMDGDVFLNELYEEAKAKSVVFIEKKFNTLDDVLSLSEDVIFNCTGNGSHKLFNDKNMIPISGHLIYVKKVPGFDYFLSSTTADGSWRVTTYPQGNKLAMGLSYEEKGWIEKPDPKTIQTLINNMIDFIHRKVEIKPKL